MRYPSVESSKCESKTEFKKHNDTNVLATSLGSKGFKNEEFSPRYGQTGSELGIK